MSRSTVNRYALVPFAASHDTILLEPFSCSGLPFEILLVPFSRSGLLFEIFFSRSAVITIRSKFLTSHSAVQDHPFEILLLPFSRSGLPFENFFSHSDVITIRSKFFASRSAVIPIHSE